jgi:hypothetical protein
VSYLVGSQLAQKREINLTNNVYKAILWLSHGFSVVGGKAQKSPHSGKMAFLVNQQPEEVIDEAYHIGSQRNRCHCF